MLGASGGRKVRRQVIWGEGDMKKRAGFVFLLALVFTIASPAAAKATEPNDESATYEFFLEVTNVAQSPLGDTISVMGEGQFGTHPKFASGGGSFTFTGADGTTFAGDWTVNGLVDFQPYGCGVVFGNPIPDNLCGGRVVLDVTATTPFDPQPATLTIYCVIGSPPASAAEGVRLVVPGVGGFNRQIAGMNVYVKQ